LRRIGSSSKISRAQSRASRVGAFAAGVAYVGSTRPRRLLKWYIKLLTCLLELLVRVVRVVTGPRLERGLEAAQGILHVWGGGCASASTAPTGTLV
jgi:hypothetical protein